MSNVTHATAHALKNAGMPQPKFEFGQLWSACEGGNSFAVVLSKGYFGRDGCTYEFSTWQHTFNEESRILLPSWAFAPSLDYIAKFLPEGFTLQMWHGRHSCKIETEDTTIRTQADSFAEAAALAYLGLQNEALAPDFSGTRATSET